MKLQFYPRSIFKVPKLKGLQVPGPTHKCVSGINLTSQVKEQEKESAQSREQREVGVALGGVRRRGGGRM